MLSHVESAFRFIYIIILKEPNIGLKTYQLQCRDYRRDHGHEYETDKLPQTLSMFLSMYDISLPSVNYCRYHV